MKYYASITEAQYQKLSEASDAAADTVRLNNEALIDSHKHYTQSVAESLGMTVKELGEYIETVTEMHGHKVIWDELNASE